MRAPAWLKMVRWICSVAAMVAMQSLATAAGPVVEFSVDTATASEAGLVPAALTVTRSSTDGPLEVQYRTNARTIFDIPRPYAPIGFPLQGKDFAPLSGRVTFQPGEREAQI